MGFRQDNDRHRAWTNWIDQHREVLQKCGLPPILIEDESAWNYFLDYGNLSDGFGIWSGWRPSMLSHEEAKVFLQFLTSDAVEEYAPISLSILKELKKICSL